MKKAEFINMNVSFDKGNNTFSSENAKYTLNKDVTV